MSIMRPKRIWEEKTSQGGEAKTYSDSLAGDFSWTFWKGGKGEDSKT